MGKTIKSIFNFILALVFMISMIYISFFTDIPTKTGNTIKSKIEEVKNKYEDYSSDFKINNLGISLNTYYYDKLSDGQKKIYSSIANAVKKFEDEFVVREYKAGDKDNFADEVSKAIEAFINDHPEAFYLQSQYSTYVLSGFDGNIGYIKLNYTEDNIETANEKLNIMEQKINEYIEGCENLSDYEKELKIHDKLAYSITYSDLEELPRQYHTIEGTLLEGIGVCDSFTKTLQIMYDKVGIESIIVLGTLDNNPHAWNLVKIDGSWYHVDITSSRSIYDETNIINHAYFNLTDEKIKKVCTIDTPELLPEATAEKYNYYVYNDYWIDKDDNLNDELSRMYHEDEDKSYLEFYLNDNVTNKISSILVALRSIDPNFITNSKMYYYNIQNAIIIVKN